MQIKATKQASADLTENYLSKLCSKADLPATPTFATQLPHLEDHLKHLFQQGFLSVFNLLLNKGCKADGKFAFKHSLESFFFFFLYQFIGFILLVHQHGVPLNYREVLTQF